MRPVITIECRDDDIFMSDTLFIEPSFQLAIVFMLISLLVLIVGWILTSAVLRVAFR